MEEDVTAWVVSLEGSQCGLSVVTMMFRVLQERPGDLIGELLAQSPHHTQGQAETQRGEATGPGHSASWWPSWN